jgi:two-component system sensor histidine kinase BaeS
LRDVVEGVTAGHAARAAREGIALRADVPAVTMDADPLVIESVLRNLLDNAIKACIAGGGLEISIEAHRDGPEVVVEISDDGIGFPPRDAAMIFEKFYRSGDAGSNPMPGTGLGLYVVRRLAEISDAGVVARSEGPGKGATVTVTWPAART